MLKKILMALGVVTALVLICLNLYAVISGKTYVYKALWYNLADIDDYKIFNNRRISRSTDRQPWPLSKSYNRTPLSSTLTDAVTKYKTVAFLVVKDDSLIYERYDDDYSSNSYSNSFSVAKSVVSILVGAAIKEGEIKSLAEPVANYLEDFRKEGKEKITLGHLLTMSSGLNWDESYSSPFSMTTEAYYGTDIPYLMSRIKATEEPGKYFKYLSGNTQIVAMVVEKATGKRISTYAKEKLWQPLGMENDALWSLDKPDGSEKAYCCINSNARDFARLGLLYLHKGNWKGVQLIDSGFVKTSVTPAPLLNTEDGTSIDFYGLHWWIIPDTEGIKAFYARGILGQYIIVIPDRNMVIVRLGKSRGNKTGKEQLEDVLIYVKEVSEIF